MRKEYSAGAIVFRRVKKDILFLLIFTRKSQAWGFPKGHGEDGESILDTALREVREESGITDLSFIRGFEEELVYPIISKRPPHAGEQVEKHSLYFLAQATQQEVVIDNDEIIDYKWLPYQEALQCLKFDNLRNLLAKAKERIL